MRISDCGFERRGSRSRKREAGAGGRKRKTLFVSPASRRLLCSIRIPQSEIRNWKACLNHVSTLLSIPACEFRISSHLCFCVSEAKLFFNFPDRILFPFNLCEKSEG